MDRFLDPKDKSFDYWPVSLWLILQIKTNPQTLPTIYISLRHQLVRSALERHLSPIPLLLAHRKWPLVTSLYQSVAESGLSPEWRVMNVLLIRKSCLLYLFDLSLKLVSIFLLMSPLTHCVALRYSLSSHQLF